MTMQMPDINLLSLMMWPEILYNMTMMMQDYDNYKAATLHNLHLAKSTTNWKFFQY